MNYLIIILHIISLGALNIHRQRNYDSMTEMSLNGKFLLSILP